MRSLPKWLARSIARSWVCNILGISKQMRIAPPAEKGVFFVGYVEVGYGFVATYVHCANDYRKLAKSLGKRFIGSKLLFFFWHRAAIHKQKLCAKKADSLCTVFQRFRDFRNRANY